MVDSLMVYTCVTTFRHVIVVKFEIMSKVANLITTWILCTRTKWSMIMYIGDGGPSILVGKCMGIINYQTFTYIWFSSFFLTSSVVAEYSSESRVTLLVLFLGCKLNTLKFAGICPPTHPQISLWRIKTHRICKL